MNRLTQFVFGGVLLVAVGGCYATPPTTLTVPSDTGNVCRNLCSDLAMDLGAVVVMGNSTGCVCTVPGQDDNQRNAPSAAGAAAAGHMVLQLRQQQQQAARAAQSNK